MYATSLFFMLMFMLPQADNYPNRPDINGWTVVSTPSNLEIKNDDYKTSSVGLVTVYKNPKAPNEFVKVISRQIVLLSERPKDNRPSSNQGLSNLTENA